jgi:hypothetical protein
MPPCFTVSSRAPAALAHHQWADVRQGTLPIAQEVIFSMIQASGINDISQIYFEAARDGVDYNLAYIGSDFPTEASLAREQFDPVYMRALYQYGYEKAIKGNPWIKRPPWIPDGQETASRRSSKGFLLQSHSRHRPRKLRSVALATSAHRP